MKKIWKVYSVLSNRIRTSVTFAFMAIGLFSTLLSTIGVTLKDFTGNIWYSLIILVGVWALFYFGAYFCIGCMYKNSVSFEIRSMPVEISVGDIFSTSGVKVIGCDTHFDTRVDDEIISKTSLHGQLVLKHGKEDEIKRAVEKKANDLGLTKNGEGLYDFPLGTVIRYDSSVDNQTYLMVALTEMRKRNGQYKAYTSMPKFEQMLRRMWDEIDGIYVYNDIALPLLGTGISRFEGGGKNKEALLRCMLCTLNSSGVDLTSKIRIVIKGDAKDIPLFEYKDMFKSVPVR